MSVARTGMLPDSYKYYTIAVDSFDNRLLKGQVYHDSWDRSVAFGCISEMVLILEGMFDAMQYPTKSVDQRKFNHRCAGRQTVGPVCLSQDLVHMSTGKLGIFRLHVKYRFHATWQGDITDLGRGNTTTFSSFLELMEYFGRFLGQERGDSRYGLGKKMCEVVVRGYENFVMSGDISHPAVERRQNFGSEFDIVEMIGNILNSLSGEMEQDSVIIPRSVTFMAGNYSPATFVVRVLFRRNSTWQGMICWKEKRTQVSFRSFLEMLLLMQDAVIDSELWNQDAQPLMAVEMA